MFHFYSEDIKQYAKTTLAHSKLIIKMLQNRKICFEDIITIYENTDGCIEQYIFNISLYLLSMLAHKYNVIIGSGFGAPGHIR